VKLFHPRAYDLLPAAAMIIAGCSGETPDA